MARVGRGAIERRIAWPTAWLMASLLLATLPLAIEVSGQTAQTPASAAASAEFFETKIRPVLATNCYDCHADERMGGLRLDSRDALLKGGRSGPAIVPGDPDKS